MKRLLMIAYHFPPHAGSSGIQRTLRFAQHLPALGWEPIVLTCAEWAYERTQPDLMTEVPTSLLVERAFALDAARHFKVAGRYPALLARPDRWLSWRWDAVRRGRRLIQRYRPEAIWSTYPIATAHLIGADLQRHSSLPWIADFRDPMAQPGYPSDPRTWRAFQAIESQALTLAAASTFTTPSAVRTYRERYPHAAERAVLLENGYDEASFQSASRDADIRSLNPSGLTLLHSGVVYPQERDPTCLFEAIQVLHRAGELHPGELHVRFRAAGHDDMLQDLASRYGVEEYIQIAAPVGYRAALQEMLSADALLILQAANCNEQVPAKLYEYLRAGRPIICLADEHGDTGTTLRHAGVTLQAQLDSAPSIAGLLRQVLREGLQSASTRLALTPKSDFVAASSREGRTRELAALLERISRGDSMHASCEAAGGSS